MLSLEWHVADAFELIVNRRAVPSKIGSGSRLPPSAGVLTIAP